MKSNRYDNEASFLPATLPSKEPRRRDFVDVTAVTTAPATIYVDQPLTTLEGAKETTSGFDRSIALVIRLLPFTVVWAILAFGIALAADMGEWFAFVLFAALTAITYSRMDKREYEYSRSGLERHKIDTIADLKRDEMAHQQELKRMALEATLKMIEKRGGDDY